MFRWFRKKASEAVCKCRRIDKDTLVRHHWDDLHYQGTELLGVTLSWAATPVPYRRSRFECKLCGRKFHRDGYLPRALWIRDYPPDEKGWPTLNGERIPIYRIE